MQIYRLLTEDDTSDFCHKVSEALSKGWTLYGDPQYAFDQANGVMRCAQAVVKDRRIEVRARQDHRFSIIEVKDRGAGISPELKKQVFRPFFTSKNKGTGLGLPIARKIIEAHGGSISLESESGEGTVVTIRLPLAHSPKDDRGIPPAKGENPPTVST